MLGIATLTWLDSGEIWSFAALIGLGCMVADGDLPKLSCACTIEFLSLGETLISDAFPAVS